MPEASAQVKKGPQVKRGVVEFRLDMELEDFHPKRAQFLTKLAAVLGVRPEELAIVGLRKGCVILDCEMPDDKKQTFEEDYKAEDRSQRLEALLKEYKAKVRFELVTGFPGIIRRAAPVRQKNAITWLHLSDIHFKHGAGAAEFNQSAVTRQFLADLPTLLEEENLQPDFVFVTGDVAYSARPEEYVTASEFLRELRGRLPEPAPVFIVPGNHDVTWDKIDNKADVRNRKAFANLFDVNHYLMDSESTDDRTKTFSRLDNFFAFAGECAGFGQPPINKQYFYTSKICLPRLGIDVGIAGFNSAWCSTRKKATKKNDYEDPDRGHLLLGQQQVLTAIDDLKGTQLKLALLHHPPASEWFKTFDAEMQEQKLSEFDFVLRGHEHKSQFMGVNFGANLWLHLAAGALFEDRDHATGVNAVRMTLDDQMITVYLWRYYAKGKWDIDAERGQRYGRIELPFPERLEKRLLRVDAAP